MYFSIEFERLWVDPLDNRWSRWWSITTWYDLHCQDQGMKEKICERCLSIELAQWGWMS
jgi:hypothetical protein